MFTLKPVTESDLPELAGVHIRVWQEAYADVMDATFLSNLNVDDRLKRWQRIHEGQTDCGTFIARIDGQVVGFVSYGRARDDDTSSLLEIYAMYLLKEHWGTGIGYKMYNYTREIFKNRGSTSTYLWVLDNNDNAIKSYARWGGKISNRNKPTKINGVDMNEIMITFDF